MTARPGRPSEAASPSSRDHASEHGKYNRGRSALEIPLKRIDALLADYGSHHRTRGNLVCHVLGITLIVFGILAVLAQIRVGPVSVAEIAIATMVLYDATLDLSLAAGLLVAFALLDVGARAVGDWRIGLAAFALGWIFQAIGHAVYEKNRPAFFKNLLHLLVGPLFVVNELLKVRRVAPVSR
ncbi:MAG TPA: Mpo1-like protein [Thermoanaerobaculia bacterium]